MCLLWNAHSINNKLFEIRQLIDDNNPDICFLTETWLTSQNNYVTAMLRECGYDINHYNRIEQKGGGVAILTKCKIKIKHCKANIVQSFESLIVDIENLTLVVMYRNGKTSNSIFFNEFYQFIENIQIQYDNILICGDFNFHLNKPLDNDTVRFNEIISTFSLTQSVQFPTHKCGNTLDLIIHNETQFNVTDIYTENITSSDHNVIFFKIN